MIMHYDDCYEEIDREWYKKEAERKKQKRQPSPEETKANIEFMKSLLGIDERFK